MFGHNKSKIHMELEQSVKMLESLEAFFKDVTAGNLDPAKIMAARTGVQMTAEHLKKLIQISEQIHQMIEKEYQLV